MKPRNLADWRKEAKEVVKQPGDMTLNELRTHCKRKAEEMRYFLPNRNYEWAIEWLTMPIVEFERQWRSVAQAHINEGLAKEEFYCLVGAMREQRPGYPPAWISPEGYSGPVGVHIIDWRFRELELINYAKQKDAERLAEIAA